MSEVSVSDRCGAIIQGAGAVSYMASRLAEMHAVLSVLPVPGRAEDVERVTKKAMAHMEACMDTLGDYLSNVDAVTQEDEKATEAAFHRVQELRG